ncbi:tyrosine-type recombinase/integrase [Neolewinella sp.]|uniref:tyrosine-type recombinase/integrase n=1 Tax=Neolewinella sp. TaxID=2993543 RepID=UPI003B523C14
MPKPRRKSATAPLRWTQANTLIKGLMADRRYNTALLIGAGIYFGLRIGDILQLRWDQIQADQFVIKEGKTGKERMVDVHGNFLKLARRVGGLVKISADHPGLVFVHQRSDGDREKSISVTAANKRIRKAFATYGIDSQNASSHTLRKTFGRRIYENNGQSEHALILLSHIFGHRDIGVTRRYIGLTQETISNAYLTL